MYQDKDEAYYNHNRPELLKFVPGGIKNALDIGCGTGNFGQLLKSKFDVNVWGIEPDPKSAAIAGSKLDKVITSVFNEDSLKSIDQKFDVIFFNDVLEHLATPEEALLLAGALLNKGGHIVASIPNMRWYPVLLSLLRYKDFKYLNAGVMDKTHLRFFTQKSMIRLFVDSGYKISRIEGINKSENFRFFNIINTLLFNTQQDMKYPQFAIVAQK